MTVVTVSRTEGCILHLLWISTLFTAHLRLDPANLPMLSIQIDDDDLEEVLVHRAMLKLTYKQHASALDFSAFNMQEGDSAAGETED